jgi:hypothetical protein
VPLHRPFLWSSFSLIKLDCLVEQKALFSEVTELGLIEINKAFHNVTSRLTFPPSIKLPHVISELAEAGILRFMSRLHKPVSELVYICS